MLISQATTRLSQVSLNPCPAHWPMRSQQHSKPSLNVSALTSTHRSLVITSMLRVTHTPHQYLSMCDFWLDWFVDAVQTNVYNLLRQSPTKVPQTNIGVTAIKNVIEDACRAGVRNGGIAPGQVSEALILDIQQTTGNQDFDGFLTNGFLVHAGSLADQSQSDRNQRFSPPFRVWFKRCGSNPLCRYRHHI